MNQEPEKFHPIFHTSSTILSRFRSAVRWNYSAVSQWFLPATIVLLDAHHHLTRRQSLFLGLEM